MVCSKMFATGESVSAESGLKMTTCDGSEVLATLRTLDEVMREINEVESVKWMHDTCMLLEDRKVISP